MELKPCPRCLCPFVEHAAGPAAESFICHGCHLEVRLEPPAANSVELWNAWPRSNSTEAMVAAAQTQADALRANQATRLERLTVAVLRASGVQLHGKVGVEAAAGIVAIAHALEIELDRKFP